MCKTKNVNVYYFLNCFWFLNPWHESQIGPPACFIIYNLYSVSLCCMSLFAHDSVITINNMTGHRVISFSCLKTTQVSTFSIKLFHILIIVID